MNIPKGLFLVGISDMAGNAITAIFWFLLASFVLPKEYGELAYFIGIAGISSYIVLFGTQNTLIVYAAKNLKINSTFFTISIVLGILATVVLYIIFNRIDIGLLIFAYIINTFGSAELLGKKSFQSYAKYTITQKILTFVIGLSFYYLFGIESIIFGLALTYCAYTVVIYKIIKNSKVDFSLLKNRIGFATNNYLIQLAGPSGGQIDKLIIGTFLGFSILGNYNLALQVTMILFAIPGIVYKYTLTYDANGEENKRVKKLTLIISIISAILVITVSPILIPMFLPEYVESIKAIQIMSLDIIPSTLIYFRTSKLLGSEKSKHILISYILNLATVVSGMIFLGQQFGIIGIAIAFVLCTCIQYLYLYFVKEKNEN